MAVKKKGKTSSTTGKTRAARNRELRRKNLREELKAREYIRQLTLMAEKLNPKSKNAYEPEQVPMAKARADIYFKLLDKCLPSLKAIEHSGHLGVSHEDALKELM